MLARFLLSAWVGAAALFVINGIRLVRASVFDSAARDQIALIRFPAYYGFGFACVATALICQAGALRRAGLPRGRALAAAACVAAALVVMLADYVWVYRPLEAMVSPPGKARPADFGAYHRASEMINTVHVGLCFVAAMLLCWPRKPASASPVPHRA
jgi:uncharacterized membrane protein